MLASSLRQTGGCEEKKEPTCRNAFAPWNRVCVLAFRIVELGDSAGVAQLVEHLICNQRVGGSNPFASFRGSGATGILFH
jgi:hypothetical protein